MIKVIIPSNNIPERKYLIEILFHQFLGIPYEIMLSKESLQEYRIELENGKILIIKDAFFSLYPQNLEYLKEEAIPKKILYSIHKLFQENDLPILYGRDKIQIDNTKIVSHIDIFASVFFMLTRWEEYANNTRDEHQRFPHTESLAYKNNFLHRPVVNEYIEFLWNMLLALNYNRERKQRSFSMLITHDIDEILRYPNTTKLIKSMGGDILYRKNLFLPFKTLYDYILVSLGKKNDPYDTFDEIMDISDKFNLKSYFFFMSGGTSKYDNRYNINTPSVKQIIDKIKARGHYIGIHPSYNAYNDSKQFQLEKTTLEEITEQPIYFGREHYLRFEIPKTWQIWEDNNCQWCSNLAYAKHSGFRTGICYPYTPFNILSRKKLHLQERPLIMMEVTFMEETKNVKNFDNMAHYYLNTIKKYQGEFVLLWHNASLYETSMQQYRASYQKTIQKFKDLR